MEQKNISLSTLDALSSETIGQDILRYVGLPTLLGHEKDTLLYFLGRKLARQLQSEKLEDLFYIFHKLQWGNLELIKEKKNQFTLHLMADEVVHRIQSPIETEFRMESGFIAESLQHIQQRACECTETLNKRLYRVEFKAIFTDV